MVTDGRYLQDVSMPDDLESAQAKLIYLYLSVAESATAEELCRVLDLDKGAILAVTSTLRERGHVKRLDGRYEPV